MDSGPKLLISAEPGVPYWQFAARCLWVAVQLIAVFYVGSSGERFFYQGF
jgi:hypothetical protein